MSRRLAVLAGVAVVAALAALAALGGRFGEPHEGTATVWITRDAGAILMREETVPAGLTAMQALRRVASVRTRYGGRFVHAIDGVAGSAVGGRDWLYYVNGVLSDRSASEYRLRDGEVLWWDHRRWVGAEPRSVVVGAFPEPFVHGFAGRTRPAHIRFAAGLAAAARRLAPLIGAVRVAPLGVPVPQGANLLELRSGARSFRGHASSTAGPYRFVLRGAAAVAVATRPATVRRHEVWPR